MEIRNIFLDEYKNFLDQEKPISFLQSYEWGRVEEELSREVIRWGIYDESQLIGIVQIIGYQAKRGNFLAILHGPIIKKTYQQKFIEIIKLIFNKIYELKLNKKYSFLRANFLIENDENILNKLKNMGFRLAPRWLVSENFWLKEINKTDEALLKEMNNHHSKEILSSLQKPYLIIEKSNNIEILEIFWNLYEQLAKEKKFKPYRKELIKKEFKIFSEEKKALWYLGKIENKYYSSALIIFDNESAYYHHGASIKIKEPLNYKLHWQIILDARQKGYKYYNFWGITNQGVKHPWYGLTQFKKGFGGKQINLLPTLDYVFNFKYYLTFLFEKYLIKIQKLQ